KDVVKSFNDTGRHVSNVAFTKDGKIAAVGAYDGTVRLFDMEKRDKLPDENGKTPDWQVVEKTSVGALAFTPDAKKLIVGSGTGEVKILDAVKRTVLHTLKGHAHKTHSVVVRDDGRVFATAGMDNVVKLWDVVTGKELRSWNMREPYDENSS